MPEKDTYRRFEIHSRYLRFVYLGFFYIGDLRSGQFRDLPIISQRGKTEGPLMRIRSSQLTQNHNQIGYAWYPRRAVASFPVERSSEVTLWRYRVTVRFLSITFDRNELETWGWCQCSSRHGASTDMQHDLLRSHCNLALAWPEAKF